MDSCILYDPIKRLFDGTVWDMIIENDFSGLRESHLLISLIIVMVDFDTVCTQSVSRESGFHDSIFSRRSSVHDPRNVG